MPEAPPVSTNLQAVIKTDTVQQAGTNIYNSVQGQEGLKNYIDGQWKNFHTAVTDSNLPICLRNDFNNFYNNHKPKLDQWIENRTRIAQTLERSATLWDFQETMTAKSFSGPNIYSGTGNSYFASPNEINPANVEPPQVPLPTQ